MLLPEQIKQFVLDFDEFEKQIRMFDIQLCKSEKQFTMREKIKIFFQLQRQDTLEEILEAIEDMGNNVCNLQGHVGLLLPPEKIAGAVVAKAIANKMNPKKL